MNQSCLSSTRKILDLSHFLEGFFLVSKPLDRLIQSQLSGFLTPIFLVEVVVELSLDSNIESKSSNQYFI